MSPVSGIQHNYVKETPDIGPLIEKERDSGVSIVFVDEKGSDTLDSFIHPENVLYVFGKASISSLVGYMKPGDKSVRIITPNNLATLWPHQAATLILYDRMKKWQSQ
jgi:hypothetical protein